MIIVQQNSHQQFKHSSARSPTSNYHDIAWRSWCISKYRCSFQTVTKCTEYQHHAPVHLPKKFTIHLTIYFNLQLVIPGHVPRHKSLKSAPFHFHHSSNWHLCPVPFIIVNSGGQATGVVRMKNRSLNWKEVWIEKFEEFEKSEKFKSKSLNLKVWLWIERKFELKVCMKEGSLNCFQL
jgi:hypothetical protein